MTTRIRVLSEKTINQIAAGEVIENPASVIKELVENSIDAEATQIHVDIVGGGHQSILVKDDGIGMGKDDALLCIERHATSKLKETEDLQTLSSLGFRGEALASIGAVSKMRLETKREEDFEGTSVLLEGGSLRFVNTCSCNRGTSIFVNSLFYNVPARKKFQKSASASTTEIQRMLTRIALAFPQISFTLVSQHKILLSVVAMNSFEARAKSLLGGDLFSSSHQVLFNESSHEITGILGSAQVARSNRLGQYLLINNRSVYSPLIANCVKEAFGTRINTSQFPIFALHLRLPPQLVDVNVHPQKREVRFCETKLTMSLIKTAITTTLNREVGNELCPVEEPIFREIAEHSCSNPSSWHFKEEKRAPINVAQPEQWKFKEEDIVSDLDGIELLGLFSQYLLIRATGGENRLGISCDQIALVDLIAAQSRVQYESVMLSLKSDSKQKALQALLFPEPLDFSSEDCSLIDDNLITLAKIGIDMHPFGQNCYQVEALSPMFEMSEVKDLVLEVITACKESVESKKLAQIACKYARRQSFPKEIEAAKGLLTELLKGDNLFECPLGKPTVVYLHLTDIEKLFRKKVNGSKTH